MGIVSYRWNHGMTAAVVLLLIGGGMMFGAPRGSPLQTVGLGIVIVASLMQLLARVWMTFGRRRAPPAAREQTSASGTDPLETPGDSP